MRSVLALQQFMHSYGRFSGAGVKVLDWSVKPARPRGEPYAARRFPRLRSLLDSDSTTWGSRRDLLRSTQVGRSGLEGIFAKSRISRFSAYRSMLFGAGLVRSMLEELQREHARGLAF